MLKLQWRWLFALCDYSYCSLALLIVHNTWYKYYAMYYIFDCQYQIFKVYKAIYLTKFSERKSENIYMYTKLYCINIHLTMNPSTFNKYCIYKLLFMIVHTIRIKRWSTKCFSVGTNSTHLLMYSNIHRRFNNAN